MSKRSRFGVMNRNTRQNDIYDAHAKWVNVVTEMRQASSNLFYLINIPIYNTHSFLCKIKICLDFFLQSCVLWSYFPWPRENHHSKNLGGIRVRAKVEERLCDIKMKECWKYSIQRQSFVLTLHKRRVEQNDWFYMF